MAIRVSLDHFRRASTRLKALGTPYTPILRSEWIDKACGCLIAFKAEHLQRTGSFKYRGATNAVGILDTAVAAKGVVCHSSGNHGAAVAAAAAARGIPCTVVVPRTSPAAKLVNIERYGAKVVKCEPTQAARTQAALDEAQRMGGAAFIHPYDDATVIAGQGTIGLELFEQVPEVDAVIVPVSGGGLISGIAAAIKELKPECRVIAAEPVGKYLQTALATSTRVLDAANAEKALDTIADAIRTCAFGPTPWAIAEKLLEPEVIAVDDAQIRSAMRTMLVEMKQAVEPAGAVALAAALSPDFARLRDRQKLSNVAVIVCGGNVDPANLMEQTMNAE